MDKKQESQEDLGDDIKSTSWLTILPQLSLAGLALSAAENADLIEKIEHQVTLQVSKGHSSLFNQAVIKRIEDALSTYYLEPIKLNIKTSDNLHSTPATVKQLAIAEGISRAEHSLECDPVFQKLNHEFSAEIVKNSITLLKDNL